MIRPDWQLDISCESGIIADRLGGLAILRVRKVIDERTFTIINQDPPVINPAFIIIFLFYGIFRVSRNPRPNRFRTVHGIKRNGQCCIAIFGSYRPPTFLIRTPRQHHRRHEARGCGLPYLLVFHISFI